MRGLNVFCANLASGELVITDKQQDSLVIYREGAQFPSVKLTSTFDILALRDLLNDAYPPEVFKVDKVCRVQQKSDLRGLQSAALS